MIQPHFAEWQSTRPAKYRHAFPLAVGSLAWHRRLLEIKSLITCDEQIQVSVAIVVEERAPGTPGLSVSGDSAPTGNVSESAVAFVPIQGIFPPIRDVHVFKSVVIYIPGANSATPTGTRRSGVSSYIRKIASPLISITPARRCFAVGETLEARSIY